MTHDSSVIKASVYNEDSRALRLYFVGGKVYEYKDLPNELYMRFVFASSQGEFYNRFIKGQFECRQVEEDEE